MKGMVFTEFLEFAGRQFGEDVVDDVIEAADVPSKGAYTAVGTYSHGEMVSLVSALADKTGHPAEMLVRSFGEALSDTFAREFPDFFRRAGNLFDFLASIEEHIHVEVRKLYPDAELPTFTVESRTPARMVMLYRSPRKMGHLSEGLIIGSAKQFGVAVRVKSEALEAGDGLAVRFTVDIA